MSSVVFVTWDGAGNVAPTLAVAAELQARGHSLNLLGHGTLTDKAAAAQLAFHTYTTARSWDAGRPAGPVEMLNMIGDRRMGDDAIALALECQADLVVVDCLLFGAMQRLAEHRAPYVVLGHLCDGFIRQAARGPFGLGLRAKRLRPLQLIDGAMATVTLSIPELDRGHGPVEHVGPTVAGTPATPTEPAVLVSLSTYPYRGMQQVWQRVLTAVGGLPARVVATTGPHIDPGSLDVPHGVEIHRWLDHASILPEMSLVIGHGGHGTTMAALAHDVPVVVLPLDAGGDQPFVATSVEHLGAGRKLSKRASPSAIRTAVDELMGPGPHRDAAARLGQRIRGLDGRLGGADVIESVLRSGAGSRPTSLGPWGTST